MSPRPGALLAGRAGRGYTIATMEAVVALLVQQGSYVLLFAALVVAGLGRLSGARDRSSRARGE
ncbi:MAG: hypothetical protein M5U28_35955 [Sandaracinaceae bacterium]|nr:hypothetical protein [Sandaracinaceae bacterium]